MWHHTVMSGGHSYPISMVGKNPFVHLTNPVTTVPTVVVPLVLTFTGSGHVYDPTKPDSCSGGKSAVSRVTSSPLFNDRSYTSKGTALGTGQFVDIFQRANFYKFTTPRWAQSRLPREAVGEGAAEDELHGDRHRDVGAVRPSRQDRHEHLRRAAARALKDFSDAGVNSRTFPILLLDNVALYNGTPTDCCVLGFHTAINNPYDGGVQTLAVAEFDSTNAFTGLHDIGVLTHEIGEWMDDPVGPNTTPPWGHTGQVSGCQSNLEVGDPLTGHSMSVTTPAGTYHPQELAFYSWFFPPGPSIGVHGWYSMNGTFTTPAAPCS